MKKLLTVLLIAVLTVVLAVSASAELYSPSYYAVLKVDEGAITVDGAVDEAYGEPIFYYVADGEDDPGDYTSSANWFFTKATGDTEEVLALIQVTENFAYGYSVWTDSALYICIDTNILGWEFPTDPELTAQMMWKSFCVQLGIFDFENGDNTDLGLGINEAGETLQRNFGQNKNNADKTYPLPNSVKAADGNAENDMTDLNAKVTRDGAHVIYEVELPYAKALSFVPTEGSSIGLDVCVDFGMYNPEDNSCVQQCLTFVNANFHGRAIADARPLYFVTDKADAAALQAAKVNKTELAADEHSISLFGCNEVPANTNFTLDEQEKTAGFGSLLLIVNPAEENVNRWTLAAPVDGTGYDTVELELYISDLAILDAANGGAQLELGSAGKEDVQEVNWSLADIKAKNQGADLVVGWNHVVLPIPESADFDISKIDYMGFYIVNPEIESAVALMFDNIRLSDAQAVLAAEAKEDAANMDERIGKLDEVTADNYVSMKIKVQGARAAYEKLDELAKSFVNADMLAKLEAAEQAIVDFENAPEEPVDPEPQQPTDPQPQQPTTPTEPEKEGNATLIIIIVVVAVVVIAGVVVLVVLKKKKA